MESGYKTIYIMGDSIAFGQFIPPHRVWTTLVSGLLAQDFPDCLLQVTAVNGETSRMALDRVHFSVLAHRPNFVFLQYGINDANRWQSDLGIQRVPSESFAANFRELISRCFAANVSEVFVGTNHQVEAKNAWPSSKTLQDSVKSHNEVLRNIVRDLVSNGQRVHLVDFEADVSTQETRILSPDGIHLGSAGHLRYAEIVYPILKKALAQSGSV